MRQSFTKGHRGPKPVRQMSRIDWDAVRAYLLERGWETVYRREQPSGQVWVKNGEVYTLDQAYDKERGFPVELREELQRL